jgi:N-methylhydantoinase A
MSTVLVPEAAGVLSALGLVAADERRDEVRSRVVPLADAGELPSDAELDLRYGGQSHELTVAAAGDVAEAFHRAHEERYGFADRERELELVAVRRSEVRPGPRIELRGERRTVRGPALVELAGATCWVPAGWAGESDAHGTLVLRR